MRHSLPTLLQIETLHLLVCGALLSRWASLLLLQHLSQNALLQCKCTCFLLITAVSPFCLINRVCGSCARRTQFTVF